MSKVQHGKDSVTPVPVIRLIGGTPEPSRLYDCRIARPRLDSLRFHNMSPTQPAHANLKVPTAASAMSGHFDTRTAATEVADALFEELGTPAPGRGMCDLLVVFASYH